MGNSIRERNPYGAATVESVAAFERDAGVVLPEDYKSYLLEANGGMYEKDVFVDRHGAGLRVSDFLGLHNGPQDERLQENFDASTYYDLQRFRSELASYVVIGSTATGDLLLLKCQDDHVGAVFCLNHETAGEVKPISKAIHFLAPSFTSFVESLVTFEEVLEGMRGTPELSAFEARLAALKRQREEEERQWQQDKGQGD